MRIWESKIELLKEDTMEKDKEIMEQESDLITATVSESQEKIPKETTNIQSIPTFEIPNNLWSIEQIKAILEQNPWDIVVKVGNITKTISPEWLTQLKSL